MPNIRRISIALAASAIIFAMLLACLGIFLNLREHFQDQVRLEEFTLREIEMSIQASLHENANLLQMFGKGNSSTDYLARAIEGDSLQLGSAFQALLKHRKEVDQIRLVNPDGKELLRFNRLDEQSGFVPASSLQDKSSRYYMDELSTLANDQLYISRIDQNIEFGAIERPIKPTIRIGYPAILNDGSRVGYYLVNISLNALITPHVSAANIHNFIIVGDDKQVVYSTLDLKTSTDFAEKYASAETRNKTILLENSDYYFLTSKNILVDTLDTNARSQARQIHIVAAHNKTEILSLILWEALRWSLFSIPMLVLFIYYPIRYWRNVTVQNETELSLHNKEEKVLAVEQYQLARSEALRIFDENENGIISVDAKGTILSTNTAMNALFEYAEGELIGQPLELLIPRKFHTQHRLGFKHFIANVNSNEAMWNRTVKGIAKSGRIIPIKVSISVLGEDEDARFVAIVSDQSAYVETAEKIQFLETHDMESGYFNFDWICTKIDDTETESVGQSLVISMRLRGLDKVIGEKSISSPREIFCQIEDRILSVLPDKSTFISRSFLDEILIYSEFEWETEEISFLTIQLYDALCLPIQIFEKCYWVKPEIGTTLHAPCHERSPRQSEILVQQSRIAMRAAALSNSRAIRAFTPDLEGLIDRLDLIESELPSAISQGQFFLNFQPQIAIQSQELFGIETLLRWKHPTLGMVSPAEFIPIAERMGLAEMIGDWVIHESFKHSKLWREKNIDYGVLSVNISGAQLESASFLEKLQRQIDAMSLSTMRICLEITESFAMKADVNIDRKLFDARAIGLGLSIDDFGTGYSSLSRLSKLPFTQLKIDKAFVDGVPHVKLARAMFTSILHLAQNLGLEVIVEGVETKRQLDFVTREGAEIVQGYYFSKPLSAKEFEVRYGLSNVVAIEKNQKTS